MLHHELCALPRAWPWRAGGPVHAGAPALLRHGASQLQPQLHCIGGHLRRRLRGIPRHCPPLGAVAPPLLGGAHHQADGHSGHAEGDEVRRLHSPSAPRPTAPLHPSPAHVVQPPLVQQLVLPPQQRWWTSPLYRAGRGEPAGEVEVRCPGG